MRTKRKPEEKASDRRQSGILSPKDRREALEVIIRAFNNPEWMERHMERGLWRGDGFDPEHTRITVAGGRVVSAVAMAPRMIRFGPVKVPAMTVGPVATHDHYRKRGYGAAAMEDASKYMAEHGYLVAYLGGIPDFYYRFGYYPFMARTSVKFRRDRAEKESRPGRLRRMTVEDIPAVRRVYDKVTARRICAAARDAKLWRWLLGPGARTWLFGGPKVILDENGRVCGYLTLHPKGEFEIREVVVSANEASMRAALGGIVRWARRREAKEVRFPLAWDDALSVFLRHYVGAEFTMYGEPTGGALLKIVDFPRLMRTLQPAFQQRVQAAPAALGDVRFTLESELGAVGVSVSRGRVRIDAPGGGRRVRVGKRWLSGLLTGYHAPRDIAPRKGVSIPPAVMGAMEVLFPSAWPFVYQADNY